MIETINESSLHASLKKMFCKDNASTEIKLGKYICDIVCHDGKVIEIQTANFSKMKEKLNVLIKNHVVEIVYPILVNSYIKMLNADGSERSFNKSRKHGSVFQTCREISSIRHLIDQKNLKLKILYIEAIITKIDDKKGKSRYKNPRIIDKSLISILKEENYDCIKEFILNLLKMLPDAFTTEDIKNQGYKRYASYVIWFFKSLDLIYEYSKKGNRKIYKKQTKADLSISL